MKLLRVHIHSAQTCGGLLDGLNLELRTPETNYFEFDPLCFVGPNGSGKSQFLQIVAEIFQSIIHTCSPEEERSESNPSLEFEVEYLIRPEGSDNPTHIKISRKRVGRKKPQCAFAKLVKSEWEEVTADQMFNLGLLPKNVVGYTSGSNETLSLPFHVSRSGYAQEVGTAALKQASYSVVDPKLMLLDYGTNLEILVSNLMLGETSQQSDLIRHMNLDNVHSFRCIIQLNHARAPKIPSAKNAKRKGVQLTEELEQAIEDLQRCSTSYYYDEKLERYVFDYLVSDATRAAFYYFWKRSYKLYSALHKLAMLNDLMIPKASRERFNKDVKNRRFVTKLPEPQEEEKVFRFEQVRFKKKGVVEPVEYVSLSDGEHQYCQLLGTFAMLCEPNQLFLLDEPESHFNPVWRTQCISTLKNLATANGQRVTNGSKSFVNEQECVLTTHSPFVPSDLQKNKVFIFSKENGKVTAKPSPVETYGTSFDYIIEECFDIIPPVSDHSMSEINRLMKSKDPEEIRTAIDRLGYSAHRVLLNRRLRELEGKR